jgi:hypothetical protein
MIDSRFQSHGSCHLARVPCNQARLPCTISTSHTWEGKAVVGHAKPDRDLRHDKCARKVRLPVLRAQWGRAVGPCRFCSPRHRLPFNSLNQGPKRLSMTWRETSLANVARHVIGCQFTQETRWVTWQGPGFGDSFTRVQESGRFGPNPTLHRIVRVSNQSKCSYARPYHVEDRLQIRGAGGAVRREHGGVQAGHGGGVQRLRVGPATCQI